jgi:hypothetical protein
LRSALRILGALLFVAGAIALLFPNLPADLGITYEYHREALGGPLGITAKYRRYLVIPLWASGLTAAVGLALVLIPRQGKPGDDG